MTKEELERIKQAYNSGLKIQIWFDGNWEDFDIREYSMYPEPFSEHRRYRIVGSAYADFAEQRIAELEKENAELKKEVEKHKWNNIFLEDCADYDKKIAEEYTTLQERIAEFEKEIIKALNECLDYEWLPAHNGKAKYLYLQTVIDIVNEKFKEIKEK